MLIDILSVDKNTYTAKYNHIICMLYDVYVSVNLIDILGITVRSMAT